MMLSKDALSLVGALMVLVSMACGGPPIAQLELQPRTPAPPGVAPTPTIQAQPDAARVLFETGMWNLNRGAYYAALSAFERAHRLNPNDVQITLMREVTRNTIAQLNGPQVPYDQPPPP